ncbi:hypothetical protein, partial [Clostridioides difficile]
MIHLINNFKEGKVGEDKADIPPETRVRLEGHGIASTSQFNENEAT